MTKSAMSKVKPFTCEKLYLHRVVKGTFFDTYWGEVTVNHHPLELEGMMITTDPRKSEEDVVLECKSIAASFGAELVDMRGK